MSVSRLDLNSEGLLLLTNDGELKRRLELPTTGWLRRYRVRVNGQPNDLTFAPLRRGVTIDGEEFAPMEIALDSQQGANAWLTVGIREGKNREIRRAMSHIGLIVNRLIRIGYGPFKLTGMEENEVREIKRKVLRDQLGGLLTGEEVEAKPRDFRERGAGRRDEDGDRRPFARREDGDRKPFARREDGDRKPFARREDGDRKPYARREDGDRKPYEKREGGDRKPYGDRPQSDRRPFAKREDGDKPFARRDGKPFAKREDGDRKPYEKREGGDRKPYGDRPQSDRRPFAKREDGDKPYARREDGDRKPYEKREGGDRKPYGKPEGQSGKPGGKPYGKPGGKPGGFAGKGGPRTTDRAPGKGTRPEGKGPRRG